MFNISYKIIIDIFALIHFYKEETEFGGQLKEFDPGLYSINDSVIANIKME